MSFFDFQLPPLRIPGLGILGQQPLPPKKNVSADFLNVWGIFYANPANPDVSTKVFDVDSYVSLHYDHAQKVSSFPIEKGGFISYNKVNEPKTCKLKLTVHGGARVDTFLSAVENELDSVNLYNIITPERTYKNMTLHKVSYPRDAKSVDQVTIGCDFLEIVEVEAQTIAGKVIVASKKPKASPPLNTVPCHTAPTAPKRDLRLSTQLGIHSPAKP